MHLRQNPLPPAQHDELSPFCPRYQFVIELLGQRWVGAIARVLVSGPARFNEILAAIPGLSDRLLTERLRELERHGIVSRVVSIERPLRVTYRLTECGRSLEAILASVADWAERWVDLD
ncbi:MAG TPA: helix-turn-helix domain-containing protein [Candidatus Acidoferrum sp.]|nr:helix-turn-helix domain-containing protein [Candidatus Acidoferrum sp.]